MKVFTPARIARARNNRRMRPTNLIVIHCSASPNADSLFRGKTGTPSFQNPAQVIDQWHVERGFRRSDEWRKRQNPDLKAIGYHYVIDRAGLVLTGRHVDEVGAHAMGYNQKSIGICLVGIDAFSPAQWNSLAYLVTAEMARLTGRNGPADRNNPLTRFAVPQLAKERGIVICGHRELPKVAKTCPGFDVAHWLALGMENPLKEAAQ
jgi:N-acetylmuramoyl-L-alanine amidase